jgi:anaerobic dimethyl sulfoxide reductase subunit C (anchor subunit)
MKESSLVVFSIFVQTAVGTFVALCILLCGITLRAGLIFPSDLVYKTMLIVGLLLALSIAASFFHLGSPRIAWRSITNLRSSWLSREILFLILFTGAGGISMLFLSWEIGMIKIRFAIAIMTIVFGLILIYCMARVYMIRTIPSWNTWVTPVSFYLTVFMLGTLVVGVVLSIDSLRLDQLDNGVDNLWYGILPFAMKRVSIGVLLLLGLEFVLMPFWIVSLVSGLAKIQPARKRVFQSSGFLIGLRVVLMALGAGLIFLFMFQNQLSNWQVVQLPIVFLLAFLSVFTSEIIGRIVFYEARSFSDL